MAAGYELAVNLPIGHVRSYIDEDLARISFGELQRDETRILIVVTADR